MIERAFLRILVGLALLEAGLVFVDRVVEPVFGR